MRTFNIKNIFNSYFERNAIIENERIFFRRYNSLSDVVYPHYSRHDWNMIFTDVDETTFNQMADYYIDRVILVAFDKLTDEPFGFICIQESHDTPMEVFFHGGTWEHDTKHIILEYSAIVLILQFLIDSGFNIRVTCFLNNKRADKFQKSLGFVEYKRDELLSYKQLHIELFKNNIFIKRNNTI